MVPQRLRAEEAMFDFCLGHAETLSPTALRRVVASRVPSCATNVGGGKLGIKNCSKIKHFDAPLQILKGIIRDNL